MKHVVFPKTTLVRRHDTHRLIPSRYSHNGESVLVRLAENDEHLRHIFDLDDATNDRLLAEHGLAPGLGLHELVFGVPHHHIVNAAFTHPHPLGSRFNGPDRGAWYAGFELETAKAEVTFHRSTEYQEIGRFDDSVTFDDYRADLSAELHDLREDDSFGACLAANSYVISQALAERLLEQGALGVIYPSVRRRGGTCVACFRPALVGNVRKAQTYRFTWSGSARPHITRAS